MTNHIYYTLFPNDAIISSDKLTCRYELPDIFNSSSNTKIIKVLNFQTWYYSIYQEEEGGDKILIYTAMSGIGLYSDFAEDSVTINRPNGLKQDRSTNLVAFSNNDGNWLSQKEYRMYKTQRYIDLTFKGLNGKTIPIETINDPDIPGENYKLLFAVELELIY